MNLFLPAWKLTPWKLSLGKNAVPGVTRRPWRDDLFLRTTGSRL